MSGKDETLFDFPCEFPIKVMGEAADDFDSFIVSLVRRHSPDLGEGAVRTRTSRGGRYMSVTVTIQARSRAQLDAIYMDLTAHDRVLVAL
jgi:putative lipoic acid-binding regulatory protein